MFTQPENVDVPADLNYVADVVSALSCNLFRVAIFTVAMFAVRFSVVPFIDTAKRLSIVEFYACTFVTFIASV